MPGAIPFNRKPSGLNSKFGRLANAVAQNPLIAAGCAGAAFFSAPFRVLDSISSYSSSISNNIELGLGVAPRTREEEIACAVGGLTGDIAGGMFTTAAFASATGGTGTVPSAIAAAKNASVGYKALMRIAAVNQAAITTDTIIDVAIHAPKLASALAGGPQ